MQNRYNPDVLSCLANLSNDEVFTPPVVANRMLDLLPPDLWSNPQATFLDPACKTGVFLREIARRLIVGLATQIPDVQERVNHIMTRQLFGLPITELTSLLSRRSLYCSKRANGRYSVCTAFADEQGNIRYTPQQHTWERGRCRFCGASQEVYEREEGSETYAYQFIHSLQPENIFNMKFDVIIGSPPYQLSDGGGMKTNSSSGSAIPLYHRFVEQAQKLNPRYLIMIIPARWYSGGRGLDTFRNMMLNDGHISYLIDYPNSKECFPSVDIAGGVCYFLWEQETVTECNTISIIQGKQYSTKRKLNEFPVFVRNTLAVDIIHKVKSKKEKCFSEIVYSSKPFGFRSFEEGEKEAFPNSIQLFGSKGISYVDRNQIGINQDLIDKWKVIISKASAEHAGQSDNEGKKKILSKIEILPPKSICSESYLLIQTFDNKEEAENLQLYLKTLFVRFLLSTILLTQNIAKDKFMFIPVQDFARSWTDEMLYQKYGLTDDEIKLIRSTIKQIQ